AFMATSCTISISQLMLKESEVMSLLKTYDSNATHFSKKLYSKQRLIALFLFLLVLAEVILPPVSVYAASQPVKPSAPHKSDVDTKTQMKQNYAGPLITKGSGINNAPATNNAANPAIGQPVYSPLDLPNSQPGEVVDKRTATSEAFRNKDGTITQKEYFQPI